ncbi:21793_t:CDS:2 [Entrophospora sp. SA101]|nr:21793_t:CDS:2 [Entrophospora sp. SA101]
MLDYNALKNETLDYDVLKKDETLEIPGELVLAYLLKKYYPAKPGKYHVLFWDESKAIFKIQENIKDHSDELEQLMIPEDIYWKDLASRSSMFEHEKPGFVRQHEEPNDIQVFKNSHKTKKHSNAYSKLKIDHSLPYVDATKKDMTFTLAVCEIDCTSKNIC